MRNAFDTTLPIDIRYDIKGSLYKRETRGNNNSIAKKDLNFIEDKVSLNLNKHDKIYFQNVLESDAEFFAKNKIIDYSLLIGIH